MATTERSYQSAIGLVSAEATFGTQQADATLIDWFAVKDPADFAAVETVYDTDEDEITGQIGATVHNVLEKRGTIARKMKASVEIVEWALAMCFGNVAITGSSDPWTATIKQRTLCALNPPSFSIVEGLVCASGSTGTYWLYKGCVIDKLSLSVNGRGPIELTLTIKTDGSETAKTSFSWPASKYAATKLYGRHLQLLFGPLGTEDISSIVRSWKLDIDLGTVEPPSISGTTVAEQQFGAMNPKVNFTFTVKADKSHAIYGYYQGNTAVKCISKLVVSSSRQIVMTCSQGVCHATAKPNGSEVNLDVVFEEEANATDVGPMVAVCKSALATLLTASP